MILLVIIIIIVIAVVLLQLDPLQFRTNNPTEHGNLVACSSQGDVHGLCSTSVYYYTLLVTSECYYSDVRMLLLTSVYYYRLPVTLIYYYRLLVTSVYYYRLQVTSVYFYRLLVTAVCYYRILVTSVYYYRLLVMSAYYHSPHTIAWAYIVTLLWINPFEFDDDRTTINVSKYSRQTPKFLEIRAAYTSIQLQVRVCFQSK